MKKYTFILFISLLSFLSEPNNIFNLQNIVDPIILALVLFGYFFIIDYVLSLSLLIFAILGSPWLTEYLHLSNASGLNVATLASISALLTFLFRIRFNYFWFTRFRKYLKIYYIILGLLFFDIYVLLISKNVSSFLPYIGNYVRLMVVIVYSIKAGEESRRSFYVDLMIIFSCLFGVSANYAFFTRNAEIFDEKTLVALRNMALYDPNYMVILTGAVAILLIINLIESNQNEKFSNLFIWPILIICFASIIISGSRTALVSFSLAFLYLILKMRWRVVGTILSILTLSTILALRFIPEVYLQRLQNIRGGFEEAREGAYLVSLDYFFNNPIFGNGRLYYLNGMIKMAPHNTLLLCAAEGGIFFAFTYLLLFFVLFNYTRKIYKRNLRLFLQSFLLIFFIASNGLGFTIGDFDVIIFVSVFSYALYRKKIFNNIELNVSKSKVIWKKRSK